MRAEFCDSLVDLAGIREFVFLTGDLGFMALEPLQSALGPRFINAGVAEQNMVSVAAGMAREGCQPWVYSIAPFCYARPFEQIRNDICINKLPVRLVGNGGGYAYGSMGATHHALEDYGVLLSLRSIRIYVPAFGCDVGPAVRLISDRIEPSYLRLGRTELKDEKSLPPYAPWRKVLEGAAGVMIVIGPIAGGILEYARGLLLASRPAIWVLTEFGGESGCPLPAQVLQEISESKQLSIVEEHVVEGGMGQRLVHYLALHGHKIPPFHHFSAQGYPSGRYGSQAWHRRENGIDVDSIFSGIAADEKA